MPAKEEKNLYIVTYKIYSAEYPMDQEWDSHTEWKDFDDNIDAFLGAYEGNNADEVLREAREKYSYLPDFGFNVIKIY